LLLGVLAGMTPRRARAEMEEVRRRSGLGEHYERLVASYSQGMRARLGLAVIERTEPRILLLDKVHEALDHEFRDHAEGYARELLAVGGIVVAPGHDHPMLERLCTRALLLQRGTSSPTGRSATCNASTSASDTHDHGSPPAERAQHCGERSVGRAPLELVAGVMQPAGVIAQQFLIGR
jgi:ABC-2 type transport system ATP-binding protein